MKFQINYLNEISCKLFHKTPLISAVEMENIEIIKLLLTHENIDVNIPFILNKLFYKISIFNI